MMLVFSLVMMLLFSLMKANDIQERDLFDRYNRLENSYGCKAI